MADHEFILCGPEMPVEIPASTLGQFIFARLKSHNPYDVLMWEAESGKTVSPAEFLMMSVKVAEGLKEWGMQPGDVVSIMGRAGINAYAAATGALFQGGTVSPLDPSMQPDVFRCILRTVEPKFVFCDVEMAEAVVEVLSLLDLPARLILLNRKLEEKESHQTFEQFIKSKVDLRTFRPFASNDVEENVAFLVCSSGTTGIPKPVMITHRNLVYQIMVWGLLGSSNKILTCPAITFSYFFWISGVLLYLTAVCLNFEMTIVQNLEGRHVLQVIERHRPIWGMFSPALVKYLTSHADFKTQNVSSMALMITGGSSLQKILVDRIKELWGVHMVCKQSYGVTEVSGAATSSGIEDDDLSVGRLLPGFQMKVVSMSDGSILGPEEEGEIFLKSPSVMKGYMGNESATKDVLENGWYRTGDVGRYTEAGLVYITGRRRDLFTYHNIQISPAELEEVIASIPGVVDAGVAGVKEDEENSVPVALVVKAKGSDLTEEEIADFVKENVAEGKELCGGVFFVDVIPRTPSGKMKRVDLQDKVEFLYESRILESRNLA